MRRGFQDIMIPALRLRIHIGDLLAALQFHGNLEDGRILAVRRFVVGSKGRLERRSGQILNENLDFLYIGLLILLKPRNYEFFILPLKCESRQRRADDVLVLEIQKILVCPIFRLSARFVAIERNVVDLVLSGNPCVDSAETGRGTDEESSNFPVALKEA